jgi:hypothetical protein
VQACFANPNNKDCIKGMACLVYFVYNIYKNKKKIFFRWAVSRAWRAWYMFCLFYVLFWKASALG